MTFALRCLFLLGLLLCAQSLLAKEYYTVYEIDQAKAEARAKHLPIAWMSTPIGYLNSGWDHQSRGSEAELTLLALRTLQGQAVLILQNVDDDLPHMPANVIARVEVMDEGNTPPHGDHYTAPKIIYGDPDLKTFFSCTVAPDLRRDREAAITIALNRIQNDAQAQALIQGNGAPATTPVSVPAATPAPNEPSSSSMLATVISAAMSGTLFKIVIAGLVLVIGLIAFVALRKRG